MLILIKYWGYIGTAVGVALLCLFLHSLDVRRIELNHKEDLASLNKRAKAQCDNDKRITTEISNEYQKNLRAASDKRDALGRMYNDNTCVTVTASGVSGHNAASKDKGLHGKDGVSVGALRNYAFDAEQVGLQLDACQRFLGVLAKGKR